MTTTTKKGFREEHILFDGGSVNHIVKEIPEVKCIDNMNKKIQQNPIEAAPIAEASTSMIDVK